MENKTFRLYFLLFFVANREVFCHIFKTRSTENTGSPLFTHEQLLAFIKEVVMYESQICILSAKPHGSNIVHAKCSSGPEEAKMANHNC